MKLLNKILIIFFALLLNSNFASYLIPSTLEMPELDLNHLTTPMPFTPGGFKGAGEIGAIGPPLTLASAIENALSSLNVTVRYLPLKPENVWKLIKTARSDKRTTVKVLEG